MLCQIYKEGSEIKSSPQPSRLNFHIEHVLYVISFGIELSYTSNLEGFIMIFLIRIESAEADYMNWGLL